MENIISSEICKKCGECCKHYPFVELSQNDIYELEKMTGLPLDVFANQKGEEVEEYFLSFKENGDCFFLNDNNGSCFCGVYEARPALCRKYPSKPSQNEVCHSNRKMILLNNSG